MGGERGGQGEAGGALVVGSILPSQPVHHQIPRSPPRPSGELCLKAAPRSSPVGETILSHPRFPCKAPRGNPAPCFFFFGGGDHRLPSRPPCFALPAPLPAASRGCPVPSASPCPPRPQLLAARCRPSWSCREQGDGWMCHLAPLGERKGMDGVPPGGRVSPLASLRVLWGRCWWQGCA